MIIRSTLLLICLLLAACNIDQKNNTDQLEPLFPAPKIVPINTEGGYTLNSLTRDTIQPLINQFGDTIITGKPIPAIGRLISPDSVAQPTTIKAKSPKVFPAHSNVHKVPKDLTVIPINPDSLNVVFLEVIAENDTVHYVINSIGDTIPTGVPIIIKGKKVNVTWPQPTPALPLRLKDAARTNLQYLDVDQGIASSYVRSITEDKNGNLWFGTYGGGVSRYDGTSFTHFTTKEGLSHNIVWSMTEDKNGNLWFGTDGGGINRYDGTSFTHFTTKEGLSNDRVRSILEDSSGNLWFGTVGGGVSRYDGTSFTHFTTKEGLANNNVWSITEDKSGNLWFGTDSGASRYDGKSFTHFNTKEGLSHNVVWSITEDKSGNLWFGTNGGGVSRYNGTSFTNFTTKEGLSNNVVWSITDDKSGNLWFGTDGGGVSHYDGTSFSHFTKKEGLANNNVFAITEDKGGNMWFGTWGGGVSRYDGTSFSHFTTKEGLAHNIVVPITEDKSGNLWFGTLGGGVSRFDGRSFTHYTEEEGLSDDRVFSITEDKSGNLWFGTWGGISRFDGKSFTNFTTKEGLSHNMVASITEDRYGILWFGTNGGGVSRYDGTSFTHFTTKEGLSHNIVFSITEDRNGNLWFGTGDGGVSRYDGTTFTHFTTKEGLLDNMIISIMEDKSGNLWFGTVGGGVSRYDGTSFSHITKNEGLAHNHVTSITEDKSGNLWFGGENGLTKLEYFVDSSKMPSKENRQKFTLLRFMKPDGLKGMLFYENSVCVDSKNRIWWGSGKGLTMLDLNNYTQAQKPPVVYLNQLDIDQQFIDYRNLSDSPDRFWEREITFDSVLAFENYPLDLELPYHRNHLTFHFSGIDWAAPHKIQYSYVMDGLTNQWSLPTAEPKADYRNLAHGNYKFRLRAIGESGQWGETFEYSFTINPPWWHTWWARALYLLVTLSLIFGYNQWRTNTLKKQKASLEQTVKDRTIELEKEKRRAEEQKERAVQSEKYKEQFLANMSHEIRTPMHAISGMVKILKRNKHPKSQDAFLDAMQTSSDNLVVILNDVLDLSKIEAGKLDIESIPMSPTVIIENVIQILKYKAEEKGLHLNYKVDENVPDLVMGDPTRLNQILINLVGNAIKFTEKGRVDISLTKENDQLKFSIKDTGIGIPKEKVETIFGAFEQAKDSATRNYGGTGLGLNISKQLVKLQKGKIWVESIVNKGSTFFVELPLITAAKDALSQNIITDAKLQSMSASLKGLRILLAEDNSFNQMIAKDDLTYYIEDVSIDVVENGQLAVDKFKKGHYDLILMDVQMPEMNGFEASKKIREIEKREGRKNSIPIIAMTASLLKSEINNCYDAGMNNYIPKPYNAEELIGPIYTEKTRKI